MRVTGKVVGAEIVVYHDGPQADTDIVLLQCLMKNMKIPLVVAAFPQSGE
jgi:hypothetical protein